MGNCSKKYMKLNYRIYYLVLNYFNRFLRIFLSIKRSSNQFKEFSSNKYLCFNFKFDQLGCTPIHHRGTPADRGVIEQILINNDYDFSHFKQAQWVDEAYLKIKSIGMLPLIIDAGANIGLGSLFFKNKYNYSHIVSVEPSSSNVALLRLNVCNGIEVLHGAICSEKDEIDLIDPEHGEWAFSTHVSDLMKSNKLEKVKCYSFQDLTRKDCFPFILKVDIEGGEKGEFKDIVFLKKFALIIIELHDWLYPGDLTSESFLDFAGKSGFDFVHKNENIFLFNRNFSI